LNINLYQQLSIRTTHMCVHVHITVV